MDSCGKRYETDMWQHFLAEIEENPAKEKIDFTKEIKSKEIILNKSNMQKGINSYVRAVHDINVDKGFWEKERNVGEMLMLVVSELGEAIEAHRKGRFASLEAFEIRGLDGEETDINADFEELIKDTFEDEIADAVIRLFDMCGGLGINLEKHISAKLEYNKTRPKLHGKKY